MVLTEIVVRKSLLGIAEIVHLDMILSESRNVTNVATTRLSWRASSARNFERYVTNFAPHKALKSIASGKLIVDEKVIAHCAAANSL